MPVMIVVDVEGNKGSVQIGALQLGEKRHLVILFEVFS